MPTPSGLAAFWTTSIPSSALPASHALAALQGACARRRTWPIRLTERSGWRKPARRWQGRSTDLPALSCLQKRTLPQRPVESGQAPDRRLQPLPRRRHHLGLRPLHRSDPTLLRGQCRPGRGRDILSLEVQRSYAPDESVLGGTVPAPRTRNLTWISSNGSKSTSRTSSASKGCGRGNMA